MVRAAAGCLLACLAPAAAAGAGDSLSLLQAGVHAQPAGGAQPKAGGGHKFYFISGSEFAFTRGVHALEPNSSVHFDLQRGCRVHDEYGANDCYLRWNALNKGLATVHMGTGLHRGDRVYSGLKSSAITHNSFMWGLAGLFDGDEFEVNSSCQLCEGTCSINYQKLSYYASFEYPTLVDDEIICDNLDQVTDWAVFNDTRLPPGPFGAGDIDAAWLKMVGDVQFRIGVDDRDGNKRLDETLSFKVGLDHTKPTETPETPMMLQLEQGLQQEQRKARSLLGVFREAASASFWRTLWGKAGQHGTAEQVGSDEEQLTAQRQRHADFKKTRSIFRHTPKKKEQTTVFKKDWSEGVKKLAGKMSAFRVGLKVWFMENGDFHNISIVDHKHCASMDAKGSFDCRIPFDKELALKFSAHFYNNLREGDTVDLKIEPKVGGMVGGMLQKFLKPLKLSLPLCGKEATELTIFDQTIPYMPPRCGVYTFDTELPPWHVTLPDLSSIPFTYPEGTRNLPMLPKTLGAAPPITVGVMLTTKHKDGTPFGSYSLDLGFE